MPRISSRLIDFPSDITQSGHRESGPKNTNKTFQLRLSGISVDLSESSPCQFLI